MKSLLVLSLAAVLLQPVFPKFCGNDTYRPLCSSSCGYCKNRDPDCTAPGDICNDGCLPQWTNPPHCDRMLNLAMKKSARASNVTVYPENPPRKWEARYAVDGRKDRTAPDNTTLSLTCSSSQPKLGQTVTWWQLHLRQTISIRKINIYARQDKSSDQFNESLLFYFDVTTHNWTQKDFDPNPKYKIYTVTVTPMQPVITSSIVIRRETEKLTICEVEMFEVCSNGIYGENCTELCGHCLNGEPCNKTDGGCLDGCSHGWTGKTCKQCANGYYGNNCSSCGHCKGSEPCNKDNQRCENGCEIGWKDTPLCIDECDDGTFGIGCNVNCHCFKDPCNKATGTCPSSNCAAGWKGLTCSEECDDGQYGYGCRMDCHCLNISRCNKTNGVCLDSKCAPGWLGNSCSQECSDGRFGDECRENCHCKDENPCNKVNGTCAGYECSLGWRGNMCSQECEDGKFGQSCSGICGHCKNNKPCDKINGSCEFVNGCEDEWRGDGCNEKHEGDTIKIAVVSSVSAVSLFVIISGIAVCCRRRRTLHGVDSMNTGEDNIAPTTLAELFTPEPTQYESMHYERLNRIQLNDDNRYGAITQHDGVGSTTAAKPVAGSATGSEIVDQEIARDYLTPMSLAVK